MLSNHMLMDLYGVLVAVRSEPFMFLPDVYREISCLLDHSTDHNSIRMLLRDRIPGNQPLLEFLYTDNRYATSFTCKDQATIFILKWVLSHLAQLAEQGKAEQIIDFVDAVHDVPLIAYQPPYKIAKRKFIKLLRNYKRKWKARPLC